MNINVRAAANHLFGILKVYVSAALIGALTAIGFGLMYAEPWIGATLFILLEAVVIGFYFLRKKGLAVEVGDIRIEFGQSPEKRLARNPSRLSSNSSIS